MTSPTGRKAFRWWMIFLVHALGIPVIHGAMQPQTSRLLPMSDFYWFQNKPEDYSLERIRSNYEYSDEEAERILKDHVSQEAVSDIYTPVMIFRDGNFAGSGALYKDGGRQLIITVRHLFWLGKSGTYTYQMLRPMDPTMHPISEIRFPSEPSCDYAIGLIGPAAVVEGQTKYEQLLASHPIRCEKAEPLALTSLITGKLYVSHLNIINKVNGELFARRAFFGRAIINTGESGTIYLGDDGQVYMYGENLTLSNEGRDIFGVTGIDPPKLAHFAHIVEKLPMHEILAD